MSQTLVPASRPALRGELAMAFQEPLTVLVRLRAGKPVAADATSFRIHIKQLIGASDQRARALGYDGSLVKLAAYAFIAFLDESVLASSRPTFAEWSREPLQQEVFGDHMAGVNFFRNVDELLARQDSEAVADVLEVYQFCLLLGFRGRYGKGDAAGIYGVTSAIDEKIRRIRGGTSTELVDGWQLRADETIVAEPDPWGRRLAWIAIGAALFAAVLFFVYSWILRDWLRDLQAIG